jgi:hypothetical protein
LEDVYFATLHSHRLAAPAATQTAGHNEATNNAEKAA